jgi:hypothetical protein
MPVVNSFSTACVTFQFSFWSITGQFEKDKQDAESLTEINTGKYWLQCEVMIFP